MGLFSLGSCEIIKQERERLKRDVNREKRKKTGQKVCRKIITVTIVKERGQREHSRL